MQHFKDVELARVKMDEQTRSQKEFAKFRQDVERTYEMKANALMNREKNAIDRLQKQQEVRRGRDECQGKHCGPHHSQALITITIWTFPALCPGLKLFLWVIIDSSTHLNAKCILLVSQMDENNVYMQRQTILKEIEKVRNRENDLKLRTEGFEK